MAIPQGPQIPSFVQLARWVIAPMTFMEECASKYGDIFRLNLSSNIPNLVLVSNPQALQQILTNDTREDFRAPGDVNDLFKTLLGNNSVITLSGAEHQRQRQLMMPPLHGDRMRNYSDVIHEVTKEVCDRLPHNQPIDARSITQAITLRVIMQAVFGLYRGDRATKLEQLLGKLLDRGSSPLRVLMLYVPALRQEFGGFGPWASLMRLQQEVDDLLYAEIQSRRDNPDPSRTDILNLLMAARDEAGQSMTDVELRDELMTLLVAGHETTATALAWAIYWIHKLPAVKDRLMAEIDRLGDHPDVNTILKLPYLDAVCNETLRIYPVGMLTFPRVTTKAISLAGTELAPGTVVIGSIYLTHHREDLYPQSKQFKPERFLEGQFTPFEFLPFGGGARRCIGSAFAIFEMKLALVDILSRWDLELRTDREIRAKRRGLVTAPERPIEIVVKGQRSPSSTLLETTV